MVTKTECDGNYLIASQTVTVLDGATTKQVLKQMQSVESQSVACSTSAGTCTSKESHILKLKLLPDSSPGNSCQNNLKFRIVPNDIRKFNGDCLFMALAQFLHPKCDPRDSLRFHCLIRQVIVNYLTREESDLATWKKYSIILKDNHQSRIKEFRNYAPESPCKVFHTKIQKAYKRYMIKEGNFGTMAELDAAMELFGFKTTLIQENHNPSEKQFSVYNIGNSQRLHHLYLLFTGHIDSGHFQKLELMTTVTFCNVEVPVGNYQVDSHCEAHSFISLSKILPPNPDSEIKPSPRSFNEHKRSLNDNDHLNDLLQTTKRMKLEEREILPLPSDSDSSNGNSEGGVLNLEPGSGPGPGLDDPQYIPGDLTKSDMRGIRSNFLSSCFRNQNINEEGNNQKSKAFKSLPAAPASRLPAHYSEDVEDTKQGRGGHAVTSFHMYLPPWSETPFQVLQSSIRVHIVDKSFLLMDIATATTATPTVKNLILIDGIFDIQAGATYSLKNVTDHGICMKIFHP